MSPAQGSADDGSRFAQPARLEITPVGWPAGRGARREVYQTPPEIAAKASRVLNPQ